MIVNSVLHGRKGVVLLVAALLSTQPALAGSNYYTWSNAKGFQNAKKCSLVETDDIPLYIVDSSTPAELQISKSDKTEVPNRSVVRLVGAKSAQTPVQVVGLPIPGADGLLSATGTVNSDVLKELAGHVLLLGHGSPTATFGKSKVPVAGSFLEVEIKDGSYLISHCGRGDKAQGYVLFNVYTLKSNEPVLEIGLSRDQMAILSDSSAYTTKEAETIAAGSRASGKTTAAASKPALAAGSTASATSTTTASQPTTDAAATASASSSQADSSASSPAVKSNSLLCSSNDVLINIRDASLKNVIFQAKNGEQVKLLSTSTKQTTLAGSSVTLINVKFPNRDQSKTSGWVDQTYVQSGTQCRKIAQAAPPVVLKPVVTPTPTPAPPVVATPAPTPVVQKVIPGKPSNCAEETIISHAKSTERVDFDNASESGGHCAYGVRLELQSSKVGGVTDGLGDAIDFLSALTKHGYVPSGIMDPNLAPAGAIIVFGGPNSKLYLRDGEKDRSAGSSNMAGNWAGHVTIKGDDGFYYTDGRTKEPAIGWVNGRNVQHRRNVFQIFVPGPSLVQQYAGKCPGMNI